MMAKIKETDKTLQVEGVYLADGYDYTLDEIEVIPEFTQFGSSIDWEQRRFELVKVVMQGSIVPKDAMPDTVFASKVLELADAVLTEYRKGDNE